jgi:hypothetical protein
MVFTGRSVFIFTLMTHDRWLRKLVLFVHVKHIASKCNINHSTFHSLSLAVKLITDVMNAVLGEPLKDILTKWLAVTQWCC